MLCFIAFSFGLNIYVIVLDVEITIYKRFIYIDYKHWIK